MGPPPLILRGGSDPENISLLGSLFHGAACCANTQNPRRLRRKYPKNPPPAAQIPKVLTACGANTKIPSACGAYTRISAACGANTPKNAACGANTQNPAACGANTEISAACGANTQIPAAYLPNLGYPEIGTPEMQEILTGLGDPCRIREGGPAPEK